MDIKNGLKILSKYDFDVHPLWKYDDDTDLYYPIFHPDEFPEKGIDLMIRASFHAKSGLELTGYIVGFQNVFSIAIFEQNEVFRFNKNLPDMGLEAFDKLLRTLPSNANLMISDIFPLKYETTIDLNNYKNFSGEFDAFEKLKDNRDTRWKKN